MPVIKISDEAKDIFLEYEKMYSSGRTALEKKGQEPALLFAVAAAIEKLEHSIAEIIQNKAGA